MLNTAVKPEPVSIVTARGILAGEVPLLGSPDVTITKEDTNEPWSHTFFAPDEEVKWLSTPAQRSNFAPKALNYAEEKAVNADVLDDTGADVARKVYEQAAAEALSTLLGYSQRNPYQSGRLRARVCQAIREELASLVEEWDATQRGEQCL